MAAKNHAHIVDFEELFNSIGTELHDVEGLLRVPHSIGHYLEFFLGICGVTPQKVDDQLLLLVGYIETHFKGALDLLDFFDFLGSRADTSMDTEHLVAGLLVVDHSS